MSESTPMELDDWVSAAEVPPKGRGLSIEADEAERVALARRYKIPAVKALTAETLVKPLSGGRYRLTGRVEATVVLTCVVSLDDFESRVAEDFEVVFEPGAPVREEPDEIEIDVEADDPPEPLIDGRIPVGETVAQYLALAIDPYPRKPGAEPDSPLEDDGDDSDDGAETRQSPFAILRKLG